MRAAALLLVLAGCSAFAVDDPGVALWCHGNECPLESHVACLVEAYDQDAGGELGAREPLRVEWYDAGDTFAGGDVFAYSPDESTTVVTSDALLWHELEHLRAWREDGDPDREHAGDAWCPDLDPCAPIPDQERCP